MEGSSLQAGKLQGVASHRRLLVIASSFYFAWWFAVELFLPGAFNPVGSRMAVVAVILVGLAATYWSEWCHRNARFLFYGTAWLITLHYYYLFYGNHGTTNWILGCYITVMAINLCFLSRAALMAYSIFVFLLSVLLVLSLPELAQSVFFPGLITIVLQGNMRLNARLHLIQTLEDSNVRFQSLFDSTFEGIVVHEGGKIIDINEAGARLFRATRDEMVGKEILDIVHPERREQVAAKMQLADTLAYETIILAKDGTPVEIELRAKSLRYDNRPARIVTLQEISDRKRAERETIAALAMAENVRLRDEFISIASHELRTPLTALKLQIQMMDRDSGNNSLSQYTPDRLRAVIRLFLRQTDRLTELVESMLDVSRVSKGRLELDRQMLDLSGLVREVAETLLPDAIRDGKLTMRLEPVFTNGDRTRLKQVVENLITNATKYGESKPLEISVFADANDAVLTVADHGIGIASEFTRRIFNRFERAVSPKNIAGLGLGLYICRQIVEAHSGAISVESDLGKGSTFRVQLPRK